MESTHRWYVAVFVAIAVVVYGWNLSWAILAVAPVIACAIWVILGRLEPSTIRQQRLKTLNALPQAFDLIRACIRAGQPLRQAAQTVAQVVGSPVSELLGAVTNAISVGMSDAQAWEVLIDDPVMGPVARDMVRSTAWGTAMTDLLTHHSAHLRRRGLAERLALAKAVGVKSALPLGICYVPAFILIGVVPVIAGGVSGLF
jgi:pilus assembly protein TadC